MVKTLGFTALSLENLKVNKGRSCSRLIVCVFGGGGCNGGGGGCDSSGVGGVGVMVVIGYVGCCGNGGGGGRGKSGGCRNLF